MSETPEPLVVDSVGDLALLEPSGENWQHVCQVVDRFASISSDLLASVVADVRAAIARWPADVRVIGADSPWLAGIFTGTFDPRLQLVGRATIHSTRTHEPNSLYTREAFDLVELFARHLDPAFDPPQDILEDEDEIRSANGCGGGSAWKKRGNATQYISYHCSATESSAEMHHSESWDATGLAPGTSIVINHRDYYDDLCELVASGPAPAVFELAPVWEAAVKQGAYIEESRALLRATHVPWREPSPVSTVRATRSLAFRWFRGSAAPIESLLRGVFAKIAPDRPPPYLDNVTRTLTIDNIRVEVRDDVKSLEVKVEAMEDKLDVALAAIVRVAYELTLFRVER